MATKVPTDPTGASPYEKYVERMDALIRETLHKFDCRPVFFVGSGLSRRYYSTPGWSELLANVVREVAGDDEHFKYLSQKHNGQMIAVGTELTDYVFEWAWAKGKNRFPKEYFVGEHDKSLFLKHLCCEDIRSKSKNVKELDSHPLSAEISALAQTQPHALITTNYDNLLESVFNEYAPIVGEKIIRYNTDSIGEIFKIHGSCDDPASLVLTGPDYDNYRLKKKYLSAKLLTYLAEHPVFIIGYGFGDPNVTDIIEDIGEIIGGESRIIDNIFYIQWVNDLADYQNFQEEYTIGQKNYRVRAIVANDFRWIFDSISHEHTIENFNPRLLRAMSSRVYKLIRRDIPTKKVEVDYSTLEGILSMEGALPKVLGISDANNTNLTHPFVLTQVAEKLGYPTWHGAQKLIKKITNEHGINITETDNRYHCSVKTGKADKSRTRKYSKECIDLLRSARDDKPYTIKL